MHGTYKEIVGQGDGVDSRRRAFKIYTYDSTGNKEIVLYRSGWCRDETDATNQADEYCDQHNIEAEWS